MAADWTDLPKELLLLINDYLESPLYSLRIRCVCRYWGSRISPPSTFPVSNLPITNLFIPNHVVSPTSGISISSYTLSQRFILLISPPSSHPHHQSLQPWLIKLSDDQTHGPFLFHPLTRCVETFPFPPRFPGHIVRYLLDTNNLPILDLGEEVVIEDDFDISFNSAYEQKVVFSNRDNLVLFTVHQSGLALFRSGDVSWSVISEMNTPYHDVCVYKGKFFAVDNTGQTVSVGSGTNLEFVAGPVVGGTKKFLVVCNGELWLVARYIFEEEEADEEEEEEEAEEEEAEEEEAEAEEEEADEEEDQSQRTVGFEVYRLEEEKFSWVKMDNLGEWVLFLGDDHSFAANARDLGVEKGDCLVYEDHVFSIHMECVFSVFHYSEGRITPLAEHPEFSKLFWPPPDWVRFQLNPIEECKSTIRFSVNILSTVLHFETEYSIYFAGHRG